MDGDYIATATIPNQSEIDAANANKSTDTTTTQEINKEDVEKTINNIVAGVGQLKSQWSSNYQQAAVIMIGWLEDAERRVGPTSYNEIDERVREVAVEFRENATGVGGDMSRAMQELRERAIMNQKSAEEAAAQEANKAKAAEALSDLKRLQLYLEKAASGDTASEQKAKEQIVRIVEENSPETAPANITPITALNQHIDNMNDEEVQRRVARSYKTAERMHVNGVSVEEITRRLEEAWDFLNSEMY